MSQAMCRVVGASSSTRLSACGFQAPIGTLQGAPALLELLCLRPQQGVPRVTWPFSCQARPLEVPGRSSSLRGRRQ